MCARVILAAVVGSMLSAGVIAQEAQVAAVVITPSPYVAPVVERVGTPVEGVKRAVVFSVDGLRPDLLLLGEAPNIRKLMARGSYTMWCQTTPFANTLPSHTSMMTGVVIDRHRVTWNGDRKLPVRWPAVPTLFEEAKRHGYSTAVVAGKSKFNVFARPGVLDWAWIPKEVIAAVGEKVKATPNAKDAAVAEEAARVIGEHRPEVMLVHFPGVDGAGHSKGWASPEQMEAIKVADRAVGTVIEAIDRAGLTEETLIILSADHGGQGKSHGKDDVRSRNIPWIAAGPGISRGLDLTKYSRRMVQTEDTFATVAWMMGIRPLTGEREGKFVEQILVTYKEPTTRPTTRAAATAKDDDDEGEELLKAVK